MTELREGIITIRTVANGFIMIVSSSTMGGQEYDSDTFVYNTVEDLCEGLATFYGDEEVEMLEDSEDV